jgi:glyoxylase-like metal-dependent hydrolase (beta-lactamase superfamily II)
VPRIGPYTLYTIDAGFLALDGGAMFGIVPKPLWEPQIPADERNRIPLNTRCLLLESSDRLILIDNGVGDKFNSKLQDIYAIDQERANLHRSLKKAGFTPSDVTDIVLTHLHFDHCGGSTQRSNDRLELVFKNARHYVQQAHWDWAMKPNDREKASFLPENLGPLEASGQLELLDGETELFPGVQVYPVNGHTEAQQIVKISGPEGTLVYVADLLPTAAHLPLAWIMGYDVRPLVSIEEKKRFINDAVEGGWTLFFEHDPFTEIANVTHGERGPVLKGKRSLGDL